MSENKKCNFIKNNIGVFLIVLIFLLISSISTSPIFTSYVFGGDSDIFKALGKLWNHGMIPYKEFFDHKGPLIIFIESIGLKINNNSIGIFIIQYASMIFAVLGIYRIVRIYNSHWNKNIICLATVLLINVYYQGGNYTEEFCLPFLTWSIYWIIKFLKDDKKEIGWKKLIFIGISLGACIFTRITNALPLCIMLLAFAISMLKKKSFLLLIKQCLIILGGILIVVTPFSIYFIVNGAFNDLIYAAFIYNLKYANSNSITLDLKTKLNIILLLVPLIMSLVIGTIAIIDKEKKRIITISLVITIIVGIIFQLTQNPYAHYYIIYVPIIMAICFLGEGQSSKKVCRIICKSAMLGVILVSFVKVGTLAIEDYNCLKDKTAEAYKEEAKKIEKQIDIKDRSNAVAYNVEPYFYYCTDIKPCYRFFILQDWHSRYDVTVKNEIKKDIKSLKAKYIIEAKGHNKLDNIINNNYAIVYSTKHLRLLKKVINNKVTNNYNS